MTTTPPSQMLLHSVNPKSQTSSIEVVQQNHHSDLGNESISGCASIRTDCTTVPAANPRRITLSPTKMNIDDEQSRTIRALVERIFEAFPPQYHSIFTQTVQMATENLHDTTIQSHADTFVGIYRAFLHEEPPLHLRNDFFHLARLIHSGQAGLVASNFLLLALDNIPPAVVQAHRNHAESVSDLTEDASS